MDRKDSYRIEMLRRVVEFGTAHVDLFPSNTLAGETFASLDSALGALSEHAGAQVSSRSAIQASAQARDAAQEILRRQLQRISDTAATMATPGMDAKFCGSTRERGQALIQLGRSFAREAHPLQKEFVQHQLPNNFIDNLNAAIAQFESEIGNHATWKTKRAHATTGVEEGFATCVTLLKRLDAVVENTIGDNARLMTEWEVTRRLGRNRIRQAAADPKEEKPQAA